ncbi:hypothetical protein CPB86DRAFT_744902 [Serendipita vermifera]|nr:hypothetical protein CPB86DRAFT_744902 [Serendipita vermifera]
MNRFDGQVPGGVLKTIVEEHRFMDEFIQLLRRRIDLDEKYHQDLAALCDTFNPEWNESAIYPLFSPILAFLKNDVTIRRTICSSVKVLLDEIPNFEPPDKLEETHSSMLDEYQQLVEVNEKLKECKDIASSRDSVAELQEWFDKQVQESDYGRKGYEHFTAIKPWDQDQISGLFVLPESDRKYRRSVCSQQIVARKVSKWHSTILPDVLERHQDRNEIMKKMLQKVANLYSDQSNRVVEQLSEAKDRLNAFSSVDCITQKHEGQSSESGHEFIHPARYVNAVTGKSNSVVIYGLDLEQVEFLGALRRNIESLSVWAG